MSDLWKNILLLDVCEINMGQSPNSSTYNSERKGLPFFQGKSEFTEKYAQVRIWCSKPQKIAQEGDVLISVRAPVGISNIAPEKCCIGRGLASLKSNTQKLDQNFLWQVINFHKSYLEGIAQGSTFDAISSKDLSTMPLKLPPLLEQKKIVSILNSADEVIDFTEKKIDKLKNLKEATINELLTKGINHKEFKQTALGRIPEGWDVKPLSKVCEVSSSKRVMQSDYVNEGVPFYRSKEIILKSKGKTVDSILYISEDQFVNLASKFGAPATGDILVTAVGTIGVCYLVGQEKFYFKDGNLLWLKNINSLLPSFLSVYLSNKITRERIIDISGGSSQSALTIEKLSEFLVPIPSSYEQEKFSRISNSFDGLIDSQRQKLTQTQSLKKSLMQDLLSGRKRVNI